MNDNFELVKSRVSAFDVWRRYGSSPLHYGNTVNCVHHNDHKPSMKLYDGKRGYFCFSCGEGGDIIKLTSALLGLSPLEAVKTMAKDFAVPIILANPKNALGISESISQVPFMRHPTPSVNTFKPSTATISPLNEAVLSYMSGRGISKGTLERYGVGTDKSGVNIVFPMKDGAGDVKAVKYRPARPVKPDEYKMWRERNTDTTVMFGTDTIDVEKSYICLTEGEIDALSLFESSIANAVSMPNGCNDRRYIHANISLFEQFERIYLFIDADERGIKAQKQLINAFGTEKCFIPAMPDDCKDANEVLVKRGKNELVSIFVNAMPARTINFEEV